jgi:hypothetical protein
MPAFTLAQTDLDDRPSAGQRHIHRAERPKLIRLDAGRDARIRDLLARGSTMLPKVLDDELLEKHSFHIIQNIELKIVSSINSYIYPHIIYVQKQ